MWKSAGRAPALRVLPWHFCLTTEEKAWKNLSQGKKTSVRLRRTSVRVQYIFTKTPTHYKTLTCKVFSSFQTILPESSNTPAFRISPTPAACFSLSK